LTGAVFIAELLALVSFALLGLVLHALMDITPASTDIVHKFFRIRHFLSGNLQTLSRIVRV
jgi:hypothetical protein